MVRGGITERVGEFTGGFGVDVTKGLTGTDCIPNPDIKIDTSCLRFRRSGKFGKLCYLAVIDGREFSRSIGRQ
jgi:hypothetical protein